jgi:hypothetical protein
MSSVVATFQHGAVHHGTNQCIQEGQKLSNFQGPMFKDWFLVTTAFLKAAEVADYLNSDYHYLPRDSFNEE